MADLLSDEQKVSVVRDILKDGPMMIPEFRKALLARGFVETQRGELLVPFDGVAVPTSDYMHEGTEDISMWSSCMFVVLKDWAGFDWWCGDWLVMADYLEERGFPMAKDLRLNAQISILKRELDRYYESCPGVDGDNARIKALHDLMSNADTEDPEEDDWEMGDEEVIDVV